jgi:hypothetical protein
MPTYSDERRIAALLRELILQSGTPADSIEIRLGWEPGRLNALLAQGVSFEVLLEVLPALDATPGDFFARLYSYSEADPYPGNGGGGGNGSHGGTAAHGGNSRAPKGPDRRFEESRRVVKAALARRFAWKQERLAC